MYADPGAAQAIIKQLNRWYRRARPHGTIDHFYRGTRMSYTAVYCHMVCVFCLILFSVAAILYFLPAASEGKSPLVILLSKLGAGVLVALAVLMLLQGFHEFAVVTDDGLIKFNLFGRETRLAWHEISTYHIRVDDNTVIFKTRGKAKLRMSLAYDGWQDFQELAAKHLNPTLYWHFIYTLANVDAKPTIPARKIRLPESFRVCGSKAAQPKEAQKGQSCRNSPDLAAQNPRKKEFVKGGGRMTIESCS